MQTEERGALSATFGETKMSNKGTKETHVSRQVGTGSAPAAAKTPQLNAQKRQKKAPRGRDQDKGASVGGSPSLSCKLLLIAGWEEEAAAADASGARSSSSREEPSHTG